MLSVLLHITRRCRSEKVVLVSAGFQGDIRTLQKLMQSRGVAYQHNHRKPMGVKALAQMLGNTLYYKRFFPYYTWNLTCGLDDKGSHSFVYIANAVCMFCLHNIETDHAILQVKGQCTHMILLVTLSALDTHARYNAVHILRCTPAYMRSAASRVLSEV